MVSAQLKDHFEQGGLIGLFFRPVELDGPPRAVSNHLGQFWEMDSSVVLPPMAPHMRFYHATDGDEVPGDAPPPFIYREGHEFPAINSEPAEIHYLSDVWATTPPFDLARTHERPMGDYGVPIASQRLSHLLAALRVPVSWIPVRLD